MKGVFPMPDSRPTLTRLHAGQTGLHFFDKPAQGLSGGDQGDGTYRNLILFADYSDPDVIRVGDTFYMVTSTFHLNPGITILESKDLVNWSFVGHAIENMANLHSVSRGDVLYPCGGTEDWTDCLQIQGYPRPLDCQTDEVPPALDRNQAHRLLSPVGCRRQSLLCRGGAQQVR